MRLEHESRPKQDQAQEAEIDHSRWDKIQKPENVDDRTFGHAMHLLYNLDVAEQQAKDSASKRRIQMNAAVYMLEEIENGILPEDVLNEVGFTQDDIDSYLKTGVIPSPRQQQIIYAEPYSLEGEAGPEPGGWRE